MTESTATTPPDPADPSHDGRRYFFEDLELPWWTINIDYVANIFYDDISDEEWHWWKRFPYVYDTLTSGEAAVVIRMATHALTLLKTLDPASTDPRLAFLGPKGAQLLVSDWMQALEAMIAASQGKATVAWIAGGAEAQKRLQTEIAARRHSPGNRANT